MKFLSTFLLFCALAFQFPAWGQSGILDSTFAGTGMIQLRHEGNSTLTTKIALQSDQKIIAIGMVSAVTFHAAAFRYHPDGTPDDSFGQNGAFLSPNENSAYLGKDGLVLPDDKILILADVMPVSNTIAVLKLNPNGTLDSTFGVNGITRIETPYNRLYPGKIAAHTDGSIYVGAVYVTSNTQLDRGLVLKITPEGALDTNFGDDGLLSISPSNASWHLGINCITNQTDGKILVGGYVGSNLSNFKWYLARINTDGTLDNTFSTDGVITPDLGNYFYETVGSILAYPDGRILAAGGSQKLPGFQYTTMRFLPNGNTDNTYGNNGKSYLDFNCCYSSIWDITPQSDGKFVACGYVSMDNLHQRISMGRFLPNGQVDATFGDAGRVVIEVNNGEKSASAYSVAIQADGKILIAGLLDIQSNILNYTGILARILPGALNSGVFNPSLKDMALSVFPNPVTSGNIQISYSLEQDTKVTLTLLPSGGMPAKRLMQTAHRQAGNQLESLELPNDLPAGQYFLLLETSLGSQLIPVIKI